MYTREEYVKICKTCKKRGSSMDKGLICSLTQEHAAFESTTCPDYEKDEIAALNMSRINNQEQRGKKYDKWLILFVGIVFLVSGVFLYLTGLRGIMVLFFATILSISGLFLTIKSFVKIMSNPAKRELDDDILDV